MRSKWNEIWRAFQGMWGPVFTGAMAVVLLATNTADVRGQGVSQFFAGLTGSNAVQDGVFTQIGDAEFSLSGSNLTVVISAYNLYSVFAGIYGPAAPGSNGPLVFGLGEGPTDDPSPPCYEGGSFWSTSFSLTPAQITNLENGLYYVNITNSGAPEGIIQGQILPAGPPTIIRAPSGNYTVSLAQIEYFGLPVYAWGTDLSIQWMNEGHAIANATSSCFFASSKTNAGPLTVVVSNPWGSVTSSIMYLSVDVGPSSLGNRNLQVSTIPVKAGAVYGSGPYTIASAVTLNETVTNDLYRFVSWTQGSKVIGTNSYIVFSNLVENESVTANFALASYHVSTGVFPTNSGVAAGTTTHEGGTRATVTAVPKAGFLFSNWTENGQVVSSQASYTFVVTNDTVLTANFVTNRFLTAAGTYNGLFFASNNVSADTAGMLRGLVVGRTGAVSGRLYVSGTDYALGGSFDVGGVWSNRIARPAAKGGPLTVMMNLDWSQSPPVINGLVSGTNGGPWTNILYAELAGTKLPSGEFTLLIPPGEGPPGTGYALITNHAGQLTISGQLADGTAFTQSVPEAASGNVPLFASLYSGGGLLLSLLNFSNGAPTGQLAWVRPAGKTGLYTNGFTNYVTVQASAWTNPPPKQAAVSLTNGPMEISGGSLTTNLFFNVAVSNNNALVKLPSSPSTNTLAGTINPRTGLLTVTFGDGQGKATLAGHGAMLQNATNGAGWFVTRTNAGAITIGPP